MNALSSTLYRIGAALSMIVGLAASAQSDSAQPSRDGVGKTKYADDAYRAAIALAKDAAKRGDVPAVEVAASSVVDAPRGTSAYEIGLAQKLIEAMDLAARDGRTDVVPQLAKAILKHLSAAEKDAASPPERAAALMTQGFVYERFLADPVTAARLYDAAATVGNDQRAAEAATRLKETERLRNEKRGGK